MMIELSLYENSDITVFGKHFAHQRPVKVLDYFRLRSPFLRDLGRAGYLQHLRRFVDVPERLPEESDVKYYDRIFDVLLENKMVVIEYDSIH